MDQSFDAQEAVSTPEKQRTNIWWIIGIVVLLLAICCCVTLVVITLLLAPVTGTVFSNIIQITAVP